MTIVPTIWPSISASQVSPASMAGIPSRSRTGRATPRRPRPKPRRRVHENGEHDINLVRPRLAELHSLHAPLARFAVRWSLSVEYRRSWTNESARSIRLQLRLGDADRQVSFQHGVGVVVARPVSASAATFAPSPACSSSMTAARSSSVPAALSAFLANSLTTAGHPGMLPGPDERRRRRRRSSFGPRGSRSAVLVTPARSSL